MLLENVKSIKVDAEIETEYAELEEMASNLLSEMHNLFEAGRIPAGALGGEGNHPSPDEAYWKNRKGGENVPQGAMGTGDDDGKLPPYSTNKGSAGNVDVGDGINQVVGSMETVTKQMEAAKRAMGILNKMADSPFRTKHKSRIMGLMNKIRGNLRRIEKKFNEIMDSDPELQAEVNYDMNGGQ